MMGDLTPEQAGERIYSLMKGIGLETNLSGLRLDGDDVDLIIEKGFNPERVKNNPRLLTKHNLKKMLGDIF